MANQDFTTWTEVDTTSLLSVTSSTVTATSLDGATTALATLYKSHGTDFFDGDFTFRLGPVEVTSADELSSVSLLLLSTRTQSTGRNNPSAYPCIALRWQGPLGSSKTLYLYQYTTTDTAVASDSYTGTAVGLNTPFYVELQRSGSTATAKIYSDAYSTLVDTLSISLTPVASYEYTIIGKWHSGSYAALSGTIQNLDLEASGGGGGGAAPTITDAGDESYVNGETGITITGTNFGASQGSGSVKISPTDNVADSNAVTQTITSWGNTSITFTAVRSTLTPSTNLYLFVTANGGYSNASGHVVSFLQVVTVTNVSDTTLNDGQTSVTITGTDFQSTQGTGRVVISPTSNINDAGAVAQTVTSWGDTSITFTAVKGSLSLNTNLYLFVENDDDVVNSTGYTVQFVGVKKLLVQLPTSAVGVTGISGVVWTKPGDTTQAGTEIGEFTGQSFESSAVGGYAVLKVPVSAFNGSSLTTSDTPVVLVQSSTHTTGLIEATIIEE